MKKIVTSLVIAVAGISLAGCIPDAPANNSTKNTQAQKAQEAANSVKFNAGNAEIDNIKRRLELTADPALQGYIVLFNDMGRPILYTTIKGKVTSGSKRLTAPFQETSLARNGTMEHSSSAFTDAPSDEGTWGSSNPYIYFWTTSGQYIQWSGNYLYSDKPIRITDSPAVMLVDSGTKSNP